GRHLVLVGRSPPTPEARAAVQALEDAGTRVEIAQVDVGCGEGLSRLFSSIGRHIPPPRGGIHAAGGPSRPNPPERPLGTFPIGLSHQDAWGMEPAPADC